MASEKTGNVAQDLEYTPTLSHQSVCKAHDDESNKSPKAFAIVTAFEHDSVVCICNLISYAPYTGAYKNSSTSKFRSTPI
ncbi:hypothetical protein V5799_007026 [Amblyomma americanum]|uniref:Uncharacterized protein n=1 Tax=Amblyomma americanum TaxID=6943 RepID=A0AAQ4DUQ6_AMBAM